MKRSFLFLLFIMSFSGSHLFGQNAWSNNGSPVGTIQIEQKKSWITVGGRLLPARRISQNAPVSGIINEIYVTPGQLVKEGDLLLNIIKDIPGESWQPVPLRARISGRITELNVVKSEEINSGKNLLTIIDQSNLILDAFISDQDVSRIRALKPKGLIARTAEDASASVSLQTISFEPDYDTGLYTARFSISPNSGFSPGQVVFIDVPIRASEGIFVNNSLIQRGFAKSFLWIIDAKGLLKLQPVETGGIFGDAVEIISGAEPGMKYLRFLSGREKEGEPFGGSKNSGESK